jgi:hypothetical protein
MVAVAAERVDLDQEHNLSFLQVLTPSQWEVVAQVVQQPLQQEEVVQTQYFRQ